MYMKSKFMLMFCLFAIYGCGSKMADEAVLMSVNSTEVQDSAISLEREKISDNEMSNTSQSPVNMQIAKKIIKDGTLSIQTDNLQKTRSVIDTLLKKLNGYAQNENYTNYSYREEYGLVLRIESNNFDKFINSISTEKIGIITEKSINTRDVTEDYYDTAIRLKNKELYLEKYRDFLKNSKTVDDMLAVQEKIRNMEEEIESAKGKLRFIDDCVNYSTLNLTLYKEKPQTAISSQMGFSTRIGNALTDGWNVIVSVFIALITLWPFFLIAIPTIYFIRKWRKSRKQKKQMPL